MVENLTKDLGKSHRIRTHRKILFDDPPAFVPQPRCKSSVTVGPVKALIPVVRRYRSVSRLPFIKNLLVHSVWADDDWFRDRHILDHLETALTSGPVCVVKRHETNVH